MSVGTTIKQLRKENEMTQTDLANKLGLSKSNISKYENDVVDPPVDIIILLSDIFQVSTDYILGKTNIKNKAETFAAHTEEEMSEEAKAELENFKDYLRMKYGK